MTDLLRGVLGADVRVAGYRTLLRREDYAVVVAQTVGSAPSVVIKLAGPRAALAAPFDRTMAINRLLREQTATPTPEVLAADASYRDWPWRYLVMTHEPGKTLASLMTRLKPDEIRTVHHQLGEAVAELHGLRFPAFGEVGANGGVPGGGAYPAALLARAGRRVATPRHREAFASALADRAAAFANVRRATLAHEDLNPTNILLRQAGGCWRLAAIVDFDSAWAGNPESDLARLELWRGMAGPEFWAAYEACHPPSPGYRDRRPVLQLLWCLEFAEPSPRHLADTARVCGELGIQPIDF